jgi:hypothetical protein
MTYDAFELFKRAVNNGVISIKVWKLFQKHGEYLSLTLAFQDFRHYSKLRCLNRAARTSKPANSSLHRATQKRCPFPVFGWEGATHVQAPAKGCLDRLLAVFELPATPFGVAFWI